MHRALLADKGYDGNRESLLIPGASCRSSRPARTARCPSIPTIIATRIAIASSAWSENSNSSAVSPRDTTSALVASRSSHDPARRRTGFFEAVARLAQHRPYSVRADPIAAPGQHPFPLAFQPTAWNRPSGKSRRCWCRAAAATPSPHSPRSPRNSLPCPGSNDQTPPLPSLVNRQNMLVP